MKININPIEIVKSIIETRNLTKKEVVKYVSEIADEAEKLADIWEQIARKIAVNEIINENDIEKLRNVILPDYVIRSNAREYTKLQGFYKYTSRAIGDKVNTLWLDEIYNQIGTLIRYRKFTNESFENIFKIISNPIFFNSENYKKELKNMIDFIEVLRNEASALRIISNNLNLEKIK